MKNESYKAGILSEYLVSIENRPRCTTRRFRAACNCKAMERTLLLSRAARRKGRATDWNRHVRAVAEGGQPLDVPGLQPHTRTDRVQHVERTAIPRMLHYSRRPPTGSQHTTALKTISRRHKNDRRTEMTKPKRNDRRKARENKRYPTR